MFLNFNLVDVARSSCVMAKNRDDSDASIACVKNVLRMMFITHVY